MTIAVSRETESTSGGSAMTADQEQTSKCIRREVAKLSDKWSALLTQLDLWQRRLDDTLPVRKCKPATHTCKVSKNIWI